MFDIGFWELLLIGVVALLVIGPERLPGVARTAGLWLGRGRRMLLNVKADIDRELKAEELKKMLDKQAESTQLGSFVEDARQAASQLRSDIETAVEDDKPADPSNKQA
ncbi:MAG: Sec-independent protein translocase protein TatB [gamma proteobacterium symbiont of Bathyaustriella thionipta]|nr:Sec-independent protein translocase protein TatB [gamma proteobacterium symbiont of Bathyaustriella thionipta]